MMSAQISLIIGGVLCLIMVVIHISFPKLFGVTEEFKKSRWISKKNVVTIHIVLIFLLAVCGVLTMMYYKELSNPKGLAAALLIAMSIFWIWRLFWQIFYFKVPKGAPPRAHVMYYVLVLIFALLALAYILQVLINVIQG